MTGNTSFLQSLGWAVFSSLWQMALLWIVYQGIIAFIKPAKASFKSSLATLMLFAGFAWFIYTFIFFYSGNTSRLPLFSTIIKEEQQTYWLQQMLTAASVAYLILFILPLFRFIRNYRYVQVIRKYGLTKTAVQWRMFVQKVAAQMDIRKKVQLWASEFVSSPVTIGFLKPVILVPLAAINQLTPQQLEAVLLHELSHIRRYDYLVNLIINFIKTVLYFNPFVNSFVKIIEREREKACDEMVLQFQYDSHEYASALLTLEKVNHSHKILTVAASGKKNDLLHRVELILGVKQRPAFSFNKLAGLLAGLLCIISLNALLTINKPLNGSRAASIASLFTPFRFSTGDTRSAATDRSTETERPVEKIIAPPEAILAGIPAPGFINVKYEPAEPPPALKKYQEAQVKEAIERSRKIFENEEWKALERKVAEVLTQKEKEELYSTYRRELGKMDWKKWEDKLRTAYDQVDWNQVNEQLVKAVNNIRLDSLQKVYTEAICKIDQVNKELISSNMKGIPDSEITLQELQKAREQMRKTLTNLKATKNKKIVHL